MCFSVPLAACFVRLCVCLSAFQCASPSRCPGASQILRRRSSAAVPFTVALARQQCVSLSACFRKSLFLRRRSSTPVGCPFLFVGLGTPVSSSAVDPQPCPSPSGASKTCIMLRPHDSSTEVHLLSRRLMPFLSLRSLFKIFCALCSLSQLCSCPP